MQHQDTAANTDDVFKDSTAPLPDLAQAPESKIESVGSKETKLLTDSDSEDDICDSWKCVKQIPDQILNLYLLGDPWSLRRVEGFLVPSNTHFGHTLDQIRCDLSDHFCNIHDLKSPLKYMHGFNVDVCNLQTLDTGHMPDNSILIFAVEVTAVSRGRRAPLTGEDDLGCLPGASGTDEQLGQVSRLSQARQHCTHMKRPPSPAHIPLTPFTSPGRDLPACSTPSGPGRSAPPPRASQPPPAPRACRPPAAERSAAPAGLWGPRCVCTLCVCVCARARARACARASARVCACSAALSEGSCPQERHRRVPGACAFFP